MYPIALQFRPAVPRVKSCVPAVATAMSRRALSPPPLTASPLTVPDSPSPRSLHGDRTPLAPVMVAPATEPMPTRPVAADALPALFTPPRRSHAGVRFAFFGCVPGLPASPLLPTPSRGCSLPMLRCIHAPILPCTVRTASRQLPKLVDHLPREPSIASRCRHMSTIGHRPRTRSTPAA